MYLQPFRAAKENRIFPKYKVHVNSMYFKESHPGLRGISSRHATDIVLKIRFWQIAPPFEVNKIFCLKRQNLKGYLTLVEPGARQQLHNDCERHTHWSGTTCWLFQAGFLRKSCFLGQLLHSCISLARPFCSSNSLLINQFPPYDSH